jgi:hypothetical protein
MAEFDLDTWLTTLHSPETATRLEALQAAAMGQVVDVASHVIDVLNDPVADVRVAAATALAQMGLSGDTARQAITALMLHQHDPDPAVQQAVSAALVRLEQSADVYAEAEEAFDPDEAEKSAPPPAKEEQSDQLEDGFFGGTTEYGSAGPAVADDEPIEVPVLPMTPSPFNPPAESGAPPPPAPAPQAPVPAAPITPGSSPAPEPAAQPAPSRNRLADEGSLEQRALQQEAQEVQFSAYFPREVVTNRWYPLTAYLFKSFAAEQVLADARSTFGAWMAAVRRVISNVRRTLPEGTVITATPYMEGVQFNPPAITFGFYEDWHRLDFRLRTTSAALYQSVNGRLTFTVEGVIVADVPLSIYVTDTVTVTSASSTNTNAGNGMQTVSQKLYKSIFCSYSHDDKAIVERVERVYKALGFDFLRDVVSLKSGEDWDSKLYALIEQADIFQLFWSSTAAQSEYVEREWRHALTLDRDGSNFIRPVYWQEPMPSVPPELNDIHFAYEPTLDDNL